MLRSIEELREMRDEFVQVHRKWKARSRAADLIAGDQWHVIWDDLTATESEPLVENTLLQALTDKSASASSVMPKLVVAPSRGTRSDRAEKNAEQKRRVYRSYWDRSILRKTIKNWYIDWFLHGAAYSVPWVDWIDPEGNATKPEERFPFFFRLDPRHAFPLSHDHQDRLTSVLVMKMRRVQDIEQDWGHDHPSLAELRFFREQSGMNPAKELEEIWYFDTDSWGVAFGDPHTVARMGWYHYVSPTQANHAQRILSWAMEPEPHNLRFCPVSEAKRSTHDDEYRGALDSVIPRLKVAQNFMARLLEDVADNVFAPVVLDGIENPEDYGPGAVLIGTGDGRAKIERDRPQVNFEARQVVFDQLSMARRDAKYPVQRSGDPDASIVSAKGVHALAGSFNTELADAQTDMELFLAQTNSATANMDETHCAGRKSIEGFENGSAFVETYNPTTLFRGDYRNRVTYGSATGFDAQNHLIQIATMRNMKGMSRRTFMLESGLVDEPLQEERDMLIEDIVKMFEGFMFSQIQAGNAEQLLRVVENVDDDSITAREAVLKAIREMVGIVPESGELGEALGAGGVGEVIEAQRSLASGGIPGNAQGQPRVGGALRRMLPPGVSRALSEVSPGGTAA